MAAYLCEDRALRWRARRHPRDGCLVVNRGWAPPPADVCFRHIQATAMPLEPKCHSVCRCTPIPVHRGVHLQSGMGCASFLKVTRGKRTALDWGARLFGAEPCLLTSMSWFSEKSEWGDKVVGTTLSLNHSFAFPAVADDAAAAAPRQTCHPCADMQSPWLTCQSMGGTSKILGSTLKDAAVVLEAVYTLVHHPS